MKKTGKKGFTIVELVIVMAVIAILASVLIPTFSNIINKANASSALQEAENAMKNVLTMSDSGTLNPGTRFYVFDSSTTLKYVFEFRNQKLNPVEIDSTEQKAHQIEAGNVQQVVVKEIDATDRNNAMVAAAIKGTFTLTFAPNNDANAVYNNDLPETMLVVMPNASASQTPTQPASSQPATPAAPQGLTATAPGENNNDGKITGLDASKKYEYKKSDAQTYTLVENSTEITGLASGVYKVRFAEVTGDNAQPASADCDVTVPEPTSQT